MNEDEGMRILRKLEARFGMIPRLYWSPAVAEAYAEVLQPHDFDWAMEVVTRALRQIPDGVPTDTQLDAMLRSRRVNDADTYKPPAEPPSGKSPRELMREGFLSEWEKSHPGEAIPAEVERLFDAMEGRRSEERVRENELRKLAELELTNHAKRNGAKTEDPTQEADQQAAQPTG